MSTPENEAPATEAVEPTKSLFAGNPSAADDAAVAAMEAVTEMPTELAPVEEIEALQNAVVETSDEAPAEVVSEEPVQDSQPEPEPTVEPEGSVAEEGAAIVEDEPAQPVEATSVEPEPATSEPGEAEQTIDPLDAMKAERAALDKKIKAEQKAKRKAVIDQIVVVARNYEIPVQDIVTALGGLPSPSKGTKAPITHRDENGNTWSGRGKTPKWLAGKNADDYRVNS